MTRKFLVPAEAPGLTLNGTTSVVLSATSAANDFAGVRFATPHTRAANFPLGNTAPDSVGMLHCTDAQFNISAFTTPTVFETSPDGSAWTDAGVANAKVLFARSASQYTLNTKYLRLTWDAGATFSFVSVVALRVASASTSIQGRMTVESLDASDVVLNTWGPTTNTLFQEGALVIQCINTYNGTARKVRVTIELTNWSAGNICNLRALNLYSGRSTFSEQNKEPIKWSNDRTITMQSTATTAGTLQLKAVASQSAALLEFRNSANTLLAYVDSLGVPTFPSMGLLDVNLSHRLVLKAGSDLSAHRDLTFFTGDAARNLTLAADVALDQNLRTTDTPTFATPTAAGHAANKGYVDTMNEVFIGAADPGLSGPYELWIDTST